MVLELTSEQQEAADHLRRLLGYGDRRIAKALGLTTGVVRWDREHRTYRYHIHGPSRLV